MARIVPVVDLFAGPGGLGEGFSQAIREGWPFRIAISVEKDPVAHQTLALRAFVRHFQRQGEQVPEAYYEYLAGKMTRKELEGGFPQEWKIAYGESLCAELGNPAGQHQPVIDKKINDVLCGSKNWLLIGGPPCQAYSLVGRSRMQDVEDYEKKQGHTFEEDHRHTLYRQYLRIIALHSPAVFVMENVKGILSAKLKGENIFPQILADLRNPSVAAKQYGWSSNGARKYRIVSFVTGKEPDSDHDGEYLIRTEHYGVPQTRHRVILLGVREDIYENIDGKISALEKQKEIELRKIIENLPRLRSGFSKGLDTDDRWREYFRDLAHANWVNGLERDVRAELRAALLVLAEQGLARKYAGMGRFPLKLCGGWYADDCLKGIPNHSTRSHMDGDLARYLFVAAYGKARRRSPHLKDFPEVLLPAHKNINQNDRDQEFSDRFKVQLWGQPASTITSHISKDGHYFIHPDPTQCRGLTVREAARIQTFPDNYLFEGGRTQQYHQVGNAVPPYLAKQLAAIVWDIFNKLGR